MPQTELEKAFESTRVIFYKYASLKEPYDKLSKDEFSQLVKEELPSLLQVSRKPLDIDYVFKELDKDGDTLLNFKEFTDLFELSNIVRLKFHHDH